MHDWLVLEFFLTIKRFEAMNTYKLYMLDKPEVEFHGPASTSFNFLNTPSRSQGRFLSGSLPALMTLSRSTSTRLRVFSFLIGWFCILMTDSRLRPWNTSWWFSWRYFWYLSHKEACLMWNPFSVNSPKIRFFVIKILLKLQIKLWLS